MRVPFVRAHRGVEAEDTLAYAASAAGSVALVSAFGFCRFRSHARVLHTSPR